MFNEILEYEFKNWKDYKYQIPFENSISYQIQIERIKEQTGHEYSANGVYFSWLLDLSIFHYQYANYAVFNLQDESIAKQHFALSSEYSYICLDYGSRSCECFKSKNIFIIMNKATFMLTNLLLSNETEKFNTIGKHLISSLNGAGCIIKKGYAKATISWFILKLFSLHAKEDITLHKLLLPKDTFPYDEVLKNWDTTDSNDINKYIELLCDAHLTQAKLDYDVYQQEEDEGEVHHLKYKELFSISTYLYPFEVLYWLKLRELKGLQNPTEFSHELMNTPIAKTFLELKEPLQKPEELPFANELIEKLKKECLDK